VLTATTCASCRSDVRILFANDGLGAAGGVDSYLDAVMAALMERGHDVAFTHVEQAPAGARMPAGIECFSVPQHGASGAIARARAWHPDLCFSHNMRSLAYERALLAQFPVVKMMHAYYGTCLSGEKAHRLPSPVACGRRLDSGCLLQYAPRRCGSLRPMTMLRQYQWAWEQHALLPEYATIVVASAHMKREYAGNGAVDERVVVVPLFPSADDAPRIPRATDDAADAVLFLGRMTRLKGGDLLVRAIAEARARSGRDVRLVMAGDGPERPVWERMARDCRVPAYFPGWLSSAGRADALSTATLLAVPSIWPEPFGLVGLEAAAAGVPAIAFDVGGIREWLHDGYNGLLAPGNPPSASELATVLLRMLTDRDRLRAMGDAARQVAATMSLPRHVEQLEQVLAEAALSRGVVAS
jgi:glycosyltransferase involved in cell wall biosynthesis